MLRRRPSNRRLGKNSTPRIVETLENRQLLAADVMSLSPADDSADVGVDTVLQATFSDPIQNGPGTGNIFLHNADDGSLIEAMNVRSDNVQIDGASVTITPSQNLPAETNISVRTDDGKFRDFGEDVANATIFFEDFESVPLQNSLLVPQFNDYVALFTGVLDVTTAGEYTFGVNSDDGQTLAIDVEQDGLDFIDDEIIYDNNTHGRQDRLSTCAFDSNDTLQSCEGQGDDGISLDVGQYEFAYFYFERGGGSGGEFFYAAGTHEAWDSEAFVLVGDDSKGIGLVDGVTVTTYKEVDGNTIGDLTAAEGVIAEDSLIIGEEKLEFADVAENAGGRFSVDNEIPGAAEWVLENDPNPFDFADEGPFGWTRDNSDLIEGGAPEYNGFTWLDKDFWIAQQGNQNRTEYELGEGTVLVADPDAHDDFIDNGGFDAAACLSVAEFGPECGLFTASVSTPMIYLDGVSENSAVLEFASSWWDEDTQSAETRVEYFDADGASLATNVLLRWESISDSENYKPVMSDDINARNELVTVSLDNPANAASMVVTFDMPYATNDWWWAIDNVKVTADVAGALSTGINDDTTWNFTTSMAPAVEPLQDVTQPGDEIVRVDGQDDGDGSDGTPPSAETVENAINDVTQKYLNFLDLDSGFTVTPSVGPTVVTGLRLFTANDAIPRDPASYRLEGGNAAGEFTLISEGDLDLPDARNAGGDIDVDLSLAFQEVLFDNAEAYSSYRLTFPTLKDAAAANSMQIAEVEFLGEAAEVDTPDAVTVGDFDGDGSVGFSDFLVLSASFGNAATPAEGDIDGDGSVGFTDFLVLSDNFGKSVDEIFAQG